MQANDAEMTRLAADGMTAKEIGIKFGIHPNVVMLAVRSINPGAFRRFAIPFQPAAGAVIRSVAHSAGYSTGLPVHHAVSLPRLRFLEN